MKATSAAALVSAALILTLTASARPAAAVETLRVCLNENIPPYSTHEGKESGGFDLAVAEAVAKRLGRELAV
jgi:ABC-type amino acid transport substrate-binding protein